MKKNYLNLVSIFFIALFGFTALNIHASNYDNGGHCSGTEKITKGFGKYITANYNAGNTTNYCNNLKGTCDNYSAKLYDLQDYIIIKLDKELHAGDTFTIKWKHRNYTSTYHKPAKMGVYVSSVKTSKMSYLGSCTTSSKHYISQKYTVNETVNYVKIKNMGTSHYPYADFDVDCITTKKIECINDNSGGSCSNGELVKGGVHSIVKNYNGGSNYNNCNNLKGHCNNHPALFYDFHDYTVVKLDHKLSAGDSFTIKWKYRNYHSSYSTPAKMGVYIAASSNDHLKYVGSFKTYSKHYVHQKITVQQDVSYVKIKNVGTSHACYADFDVSCITTEKCKESAECTGEVNSFSFYDSNSNQSTIIQNGQTYNLSELPQNIRLRVNTSGVVGATQITFDGNIVNDFNAPFDFPSSNSSISIEPGTYTLSAAVFKDQNVDGTVCDKKSITFTVEEKQIVKGSIGDIVWFDENGDTLQDGESGLGGVTVELLQNGTVIDTQVTDFNGNYTFDNLPPGEYTVAVNTSSLDEYFLTTNNNPTTYNLGEGQDITDADFGFNLKSQEEGQIAINHTITPKIVTDIETETTFRYEVTNPGTVPISNVQLTVDGYTCSERFTTDGTVPFIGGDTNGNNELDVDETWVYEETCTLRWSVNEQGENENIATVTGSDTAGNQVTDTDTDQFILRGANMEIQVSDQNPSPGETITVRLITRLLVKDVIAQYARISFHSNKYDNGRIQKAGPSHPTWADPTADRNNNSPVGASSNALDWNDGADYGEYPDWVHEFEYTIPSYAIGKITITAEDMGTIRVYDENSGEWNESSPIVAKDAITLDINPQFIWFENQADITTQSIQKNSITIYPNPVVDVVNVNAKSLENGRYTLLNVHGQVVDEGIITTGLQLNMSNLAAGTYVLSLVKDDESVSRTIIKQ